MISIAKFCYEQKINIIISVLYFNDFIFKNNKKIFKNYFQIYLKANIKDLIKRDSKKVYSQNINKKKPFLVGVDIKWNEPKKSDLIIENFFNKKVRVSREVEFFCSPLYNSIIIIEYNMTRRRHRKIPMLLDHSPFNAKTFFAPVAGPES